MEDHVPEPDLILLQPGSALVALERRTATLDVVDQLRGAITSAKLRPGTKLREAALCRGLGVGRAPIREALRQLTQEGLVTYEPHRGSAVSVITADDLIDVYSAREAIELRSVEILLSSPPGHGRAVIMAALDGLQSAAAVADSPAVAIIEADIGLHGAIVGATGSTRLSRMFRTLSAEMRMFLLHTHPPIDAPSYVDDHISLVHQIVGRNPTSVEAMRTHLAEARALLTAGFAERQDASAASQGAGAQPRLQEGQWSDDPAA